MCQGPVAGEASSPLGGEKSVVNLVKPQLGDYCTVTGNPIQYRGNQRVGFIVQQPTYRDGGVDNNGI